MYRSCFPRLETQVCTLCVFKKGPFLCVQKTFQTGLRDRGGTVFMSYLERNKSAVPRGTTNLKFSAVFGTTSA